jgi:hypothetical protein
MFLCCSRINCWIRKTISSTRVVECNWGDLPSRLIYSKNWDHFSKAHGPSSSTLWALEELGDFWDVCWVVVKPSNPWSTIFIFQVNNAKPWQPLHDYNPTSRLWERLGTNTTTIHGFFILGFLIKKYRKVISVKKNHLVNLDNSFVHVQCDQAIKLDLVILTSEMINKMTNYLISG